MVIVKDTDEQIVLRHKGWQRVVALVCIAPFALPLCAIGIGELATEGHWAVGIGTLLGGLILGFIVYYLVYFFSEITFDHTLGQMTIRRGAKPFLVRTRRISRTEIQSVDLKHTPGYSSMCGDNVDYSPEKWELFLRVGSKWEKVGVAEPFGSQDKSTAYVANRISAFQQGQ